MRIYKSPQEISIPISLSLTELLHSSARSPPLPDTHLIAKDNLTGRTLSISQLRSNAGRLAQGLNRHYSPRDQSRWAIIVPNSIAYIETFHAVLWLGGVGCPINHVLKPNEIAHALEVTRVEYVVVWSGVLGKVREAVGMAGKELGGGWRPEIITVVGEAEGWDGKRLEDFMTDTVLPIPHWDDARKRLASIHLSSGTTGKPKGVGLSHYNYVANVLQMWEHDPDHWTADTRIVAYTPFVHIANTTIPLFLGPWTGMQHICMAAFEIETFSKLVEENRANVIQGVATVALAIANTDLTERYDFSSVRQITAGGLPMKQDVYERFMSKGNWKPVMLYGMTEAAPYVVWQKVGETLPVGKIGSILLGMQGALMLENGEDAPEGGPGELWLKGPNMTSGYVENEEANRTAFKRDGWYNTGDVCTISKEGWLAVVGRTKELVKYKGFQVSPAELELHINSHSDVVESAVNGLWDESQLTELPTGYVMLKGHLKSREEKVRALREIHKMVDEQVSGYKKLRGGLWEVEMLPKNANSKFLRKQLGDHKTGLCSLQEGKMSKL
jgi:4-coumarate--CoA ligase